ncbi:MAG: hypothetical protein P8J20_17380 [Novosphingobium sp.]|nr:hypothetical protein [Novosphingobium sp.]
MLAGAVSLLALPSAVLAITAKFEPNIRTVATAETLSPIKGTKSPMALSLPIPVRSLAKGQLFPFTPAGSPNRPDRSVTVAVRVNSGEAQVISVQRLRKNQNVDNEGALLRISPNAFNLGVSRGYRSFSQGLMPSAENRSGRLPDYGRFSIAPGRQADASRFSPRIVIDEKQKAGRAPRTFAGDREDRVDVGGSYRVTEHLDVTAGVRYSEDRDRLTPLTDGKQDGQAVYVGTQFRF